MGKLQAVAQDISECFGFPYQFLFHEIINFSDLSSWAAGVWHI
jgi:hypothetical protein